MAIELVMPFSHLILCCPLLLLPSIFPSIRVHILHDLSAPQELSSMRALLRVNRQCPNIPCLAETVNNSAMQDRFGRQNEPFGYVFANLDCKSNFQFSSVAQSCPTLPLHLLQQARLPCPSPTPRLTQTHVH